MCGQWLLDQQYRSSLFQQYCWAMMKQQGCSWLLETEKICIDGTTMFPVVNMPVNKILQQCWLNNVVTTLLSCLKNIVDNVVHASQLNVVHTGPTQPCSCCMGQLNVVHAAWPAQCRSCWSAQRCLCWSAQRYLCWSAQRCSCWSAQRCSYWSAQRCSCCMASSTLFMLAQSNLVHAVWASSTLFMLASSTLFKLTLFLYVL